MMMLDKLVIVLPGEPRKLVCKFVCIIPKILQERRKMSMTKKNIKKAVRFELNRIDIPRAASQGSPEGEGFN